jgi:DNA-binding transcriptional ArsR family regulator
MKKDRISIFSANYEKDCALTCNHAVAYIGFMDKVFKALADVSRRSLLDALFEKNGQTQGELCEKLSMTRQAATKHLVILEEANLVTTKWVGREKFYFLNPAPIQETFGRWIHKYERQKIQALDHLKIELEKT